MSISNLYPHNQETYIKIIEALTQTNNLCLVQGMGVGKSFIFIALANNIFAHKRILYVVPKTTIEDNLRRYDGFENIEHHVDFATYNSFNNDDMILTAYDNYDVFVIDEAHHIGSKIFGKNLQTLLSLVKDDRNKVFIGMTATPVRDSDHVDVAKYFSVRVDGLSTFEAIEQGLMPQIEYLVCSDMIDPKIKRMYRQRLDIDNSRDLLDKIVQENPKEHWLVFYATIKDLRDNELSLKKLFPDHRIIRITSDIKKSQKQINSILPGEKVVIESVNMLLEGIHLPCMQGVLLFRNVHSLTVFTQLFGRITAIGEKKPPLFIDCTDTAQRMFSKLSAVHRNQKNNERNSETGPLRDILVTTLKNKKYFDIMTLLQQTQKISTDLYRVAFEGETYSSLREACIAIGVRETSVRYQMSTNHVSFEEAVELTMQKGKKIRVNDNYYPSVAEACRAFNVNYFTVVQYMKHKNVDLQTAIDHEIGKTQKHMINNHYYPSIKAACDANSVSYLDVLRYMKKTDSNAETAINVIKCKKKPTRKGGGANNNRPITINGEEYKSIKDALQQYGLKYTTVRNRMKTKNIGIEEAFLLLPHGIQRQ